MSEKYFPFMSVNNDRLYSADDWADYFAMFLRTGVFYSDSSQLKVVASSGMNIMVKKGAAFIGGRGYILDMDSFYTLPIADGELGRIDRIVLRCDYNNRKITIQVKKGDSNKNPVPKSLQRDADAYELALADVFVGKGVTAISDAVITDRRLDSSLCGIVTGLVEQADTTEIFNQFSAYLRQFQMYTEVDIENWTKEHKDSYVAWYQQQQQDFGEWYNSQTGQWIQDFNTWFTEVKGRLEEDQATKLHSELMKINNSLREHRTSIDLKSTKTIFNPDGSITEQGDGWSRDTVFYPNGNIEIRQKVDEIETNMEITFNEDGSISEVVK